VSTEKKPLRVLVVGTAWPPQTFLGRLMRGLVDRGLRVQIVHKDEPDHFLPYQRWLESQGRATAKWNERAADWCIHKILMLAKLPALFLDSGAERMEYWPDEVGAAYAH